MYQLLPKQLNRFEYMIGNALTQTQYRISTTYKQKLDDKYKPNLFAIIKQIEEIQYDSDVVMLSDDDVQNKIP